MKWISIIVLMLLINLPLSSQTTLTKHISGIVYDLPDEAIAKWKPKLDELKSRNHVFWYETFQPENRFEYFKDSNQIYVIATEGVHKQLKKLKSNPRFKIELPNTFDVIGRHVKTTFDTAFVYENQIRRFNIVLEEQEKLNTIVVEKKEHHRECDFIYQVKGNQEVIEMLDALGWVGSEPDFNTTIKTTKRQLEKVVFLGDVDSMYRVSDEEFYIIFRGNESILRYIEKIPYHRLDEYDIYDIAVDNPFDAKFLKLLDELPESGDLFYPIRRRGPKIVVLCTKKACEELNKLALEQKE